jgi:hypothetical protein
MYIITMFISFAFIAVIIYQFASTMAFCHIHAASDIEKYMMLHSQPTTKILINNMINKYSQRSGVPPTQIKNCIESKKKVINTVKPKPNLRSNKKVNVK